MPGLSGRDWSYVGGTLALVDALWPLLAFAVLCPHPNPNPNPNPIPSPSPSPSPSPNPSANANPSQVLCTRRYFLLPCRGRARRRHSNQQALESAG